MSTRTNNANFSITDLKIELHSLIRQGALDSRVINLLIQEGEPLQYERQLWDYKLMQPTATKSQVLSPEEKNNIDREWANMVKDEHIQIWFAVRDCFELMVRRQALLRIGFSRLQTWWQAVCRRDDYDEKALNLIEMQIKEANRIISAQQKYDPDSNEELTRFMLETLATISTGIAAYSDRGS
jgi:hypothetical protein